MHIQIPLFRATRSVIISAGMPIRKYNSSQGCKTAAINHTTKTAEVSQKIKMS